MLSIPVIMCVMHSQAFYFKQDPLIHTQGPSQASAAERILWCCFSSFPSYSGNKGGPIPAVASVFECALLALFVILPTTTGMLPAAFLFSKRRWRRR